MTTTYLKNYLPTLAVGGYISDALAKSSVRFQTLKNKGDIVRHHIACFFCVGNLLTRLQKSSRVFMVGCMGVATFMLRLKPVQPATPSISPWSGNNVSTYQGGFYAKCSSTS